MKVVDTPTLLRLTADARKQGFNRTLDPNVEKTLDPNGLHILGRPMLHGDGDCVRYSLTMLKQKGTMVPLETILDVDLAAYNALPVRGTKISESYHEDSAPATVHY